MASARSSYIGVGFIAGLTFVSMNYGGRIYFHDSTMTIGSQLVAVLAAAFALATVLLVWSRASRVLRAGLVLALAVVVLNATSSFPVLWRSISR